MSLAFFTNSQVNHGFNWLWQFPKCSSRSIEVGEATMLRQLEWCWPWKVEASFCKVKSCCWRQTINGSGGCVNYVLFFPLIVKGQNSTKIAHRSIIHDDAIWRNFLRLISFIYGLGKGKSRKLERPNSTILFGANSLLFSQFCQNVKNRNMIIMKIIKWSISAQVD